MAAGTRHHESGTDGPADQRQVLRVGLTPRSNPRHVTIVLGERQRVDITVTRPFLDGHISRRQTEASPQPADSVAVECSFVRDDRQIVRQRLGDEHAVEGIAVGPGQPPGAFGVADADR